MTTRKVSAIVLAGGRSSRFGRDKLAERIQGRSLLDHAIEAVRSSADEVIVVLAPGSVRTLPPKVRVVRDSAEFEGPLAALAGGLGAAREALVLVTGGDMPDLRPGVIALLMEAVDGTGANAVDAAVLEQAGRARPLPMVLRRDPARDAANRLIADRERRLGAIIDALSTTVVLERSWRSIDPEGRSLRDVDTPGDLRGVHETPAGG